MNNEGRIETTSHAILGIEALHFLQNTGATVERYRVGAPPLRDLPLCNVQYDVTEPNLIWFKGIEQEIKYLLEEQSVHVHKMELCGRKVNSFDASLFDHLDPVEISSKSKSTDMTILIIAYWDSDSDITWPKCVNDIRRKVMSRGCGYIRVEMLDFILAKPRYVAEVEASHPFVSAWNGHLQDDVINVINWSKDLNSMWRSIDVMYLGPNEVHDSMAFDSSTHRGVESCNPVVVSVTVDTSLHEYQWLPAEQQIRNFLDSRGFADIEIEFERGVVEHFRGSTDLCHTDHYLNHQLPWIQPIDNILRPGMSFSGSIPNTDERGRSLPTSIGTVGPILELVIEGTGIPIGEFVLTTYHAIRPWITGWRKEVRRESMPANQGSQCDEIDSEGFSDFDDSSNKVKRRAPMFQSPSPRLVKATEERYKKQARCLVQVLDCDLPPDHRHHLEERLSKVKCDLDWFATNSDRDIGSVMFASGMQRRRNKACIDYALIRLDKSRTCWNNVPSTFLGTLQGSRDFPRIEDQLFKHGAMSSTTRGHRSPVKSHISLKGSKSKSREYVVFGQENEFFAKQGDSGAPVFTRDGYWVGIVTGGVYKLHVNQPLVYVTPAELILEDIRERTGFDVRLFKPTANCHRDDLSGN